MPSARILHSYNTLAENVLLLNPGYNKHTWLCLLCLNLNLAQLWIRKYECTRSSLHNPYSCTLLFESCTSTTIHHFHRCSDGRICSCTRYTSAALEPSFSTSVHIPKNSHALGRYSNNNCSLSNYLTHTHSDRILHGRMQTH